MIWTAWNNGDYHTSGAGYGFKISYEDRIKHFQKQWETVTIILPTNDDNIEVSANVNKKSFWNKTCGEVISKNIGVWLINREMSSWPNGQPPKFKVSIVGDKRFRVEL